MKTKLPPTTKVTISRKLHRKILRRAKERGMLISSYVEEALKYDMADILVCVGDVPHESLSGLARKFGTYKNTVRIALEKLYAEEFGALPVDAKAEATR